MTSFPSQTQPPSGNSANSSHPSPAPGNGYAPSVPISVYRELAAEMQASQALLEFLKTQNQQLIQQNQQLRQEINQLAQSALYAQQLANSFEFESQVPYKLPQVKAQPVPPSEPHLESAPDLPAILPDSSQFTSDELFAEQQESSDRRSALPEKASESGGSWLILAIVFLIVILFAGAGGFLVIRSLTTK